ncbi:MAG: hypothetical protein Q8O90_07240 [Elusimicrobiota bacterium]|nr:hypothetical protein [Elusimicrobiota bacterium]
MKKSCRKIFGVPVGRRAGVTLTELMIAVSVLTIGVIGSMGAFKYINRAMLQSRIKTIATNLAQEKMEVLRNKPYFQLLVTTATAVSTGYSPNFTYDTENYPPQTITLWGMPALTRAVNVDYVSLSGSVATALPYTSTDTGMKRVTVIVMWTDSSGTRRKVRLDSYYENPTAAVLSAGFTGTVSNASGGAAVGNALVQVQGAPKWRGYSDPITGVYRFQVAPGTYTLVCSTQGYFPVTSSTLYVAAGAYTTQNFPLNKIATGTISGMAYIRDHLVISQVVGSSVNSSGQYQEWVEVFNPTTWTWIMATGLGTGVNELVHFGYDESGAAEIIPDIDYKTVSLTPNSYFLFANTGTITAAGVTRTADAVYDKDTNWANIDDLIKTGNPSTAGCVILGSEAASQEFDKVGWNATNNGLNGVAESFEGEAIAQSIGFQEGEEYTRRTASGGITPGQGRCYDTQDNDDDFVDTNPISNQPRNSSDTDVCGTGTPAEGGVVDANDGLSSSALVSSTGYFLLTSVATSAVLNANSTWEVMVTSYTIINSSAGLTITAGQNKDVGTIVLSTAIPGGIASGYVYGSGPDQNRRLGNPTIKVGSGGTNAYTNSQGYYRLFLGTGTVVVTANVGLENGSYQSADVEVTIVEGAITNVPDFHLAQGGTIKGYVTSGTGALPNIIVQATNGGPVYEDTSDSTGNYYISAATSAVAYTVTPVLDALQSYTSLPTSPLTAALTTPGSTVFSGTITVVGAMGTIAGTVVASTASITTGVLVVASTVAVTNPLPTFTAASLASQAVYYSAASQADGSYSLDVRSSTSTPYYLRAFYPIVYAVSGAVSYTSRDFSSVWVSSAGTTTTRNFVW